MSPNSFHPRLLTAAAFGFLAAHLVFSIWPSLGTIRNDFANYGVPARMVVEGRPLDRIYERRVFWGEMRRLQLPGLGSFVPHPPANALSLVPLAAFDLRTAKTLWTLTLAGAFVVAFLALRRVVDLPPSLLAVVFLLPSASLPNALLYGQPYPLLLAWASLSLLALVRGRQFLAGALLSPLLVLKLYGVPFLLGFVRGREGRVLAGLVAGCVGLAALSLVVLGWPVHAVYLREILMESLAGRVQDPYSTIWGSFSSLCHRLFQYELDLNPSPVADLPWLARALGRGLPAAVVVFAVASLPTGRPPRRWAILTLAALAASPLAGSYHFVLLILPVVVLVAETTQVRSRIAYLALLAFATSPLPHHFARFAVGWGNLLAYPRLMAVLALFLTSLGRPRRGPVLIASLVGGLAALTVPRPTEDPGWTRIPEARGYLLAEPRACSDRLMWLALEGGRAVVRDSLGSRHEGEVPSCPDGSGGARSPDGAWDLVERWESGSWNIHAVERGTGREIRVTNDPANEREPVFSASGGEVIFASDRRRGLGSTALYSVSFTPADAGEPFAGPTATEARR